MGGVFVGRRPPPTLSGSARGPQAHRERYYWLVKSVGRVAFGFYLIIGEEALASEFKAGRRGVGIRFYSKEGRLAKAWLLTPVTVLDVPRLSNGPCGMRAILRAVQCGIKLNSCLHCQRRLCAPSGRRQKGLIFRGPFSRNRQRV